jgi:hypothetical protein
MGNEISAICNCNEKGEKKNKEEFENDIRDSKVSLILDM